MIFLRGCGIFCNFASVSKKIYYRYNPETDNYERVYPSLQSRLLGVGRHLGWGLLIGAALFFIVFYCFSSPTESNLRRENSRLKAQYNMLNRRLENALRVMDNIQSRDDNFYRVMMQMDPLSRGQRYAGLDNERRYKDIKSLDDAELVSRLYKQMDLLDRQLYAQSLSFDQLRLYASNQQDKIDHIPAVLPINVKDYTMSSGYGYRRDPVFGSSRFHAGLDFAAKTGTDVFATADGVVEVASRKSGYGNCVDINHGYNYLTRYAHLNRVTVREGQKVRRGEKIGEVGSSGKSTGPHLHYEVRFKDEPQNPVNYYFLDVSPEDYDRMIQLAENSGHVMD